MAILAFLPSTALLAVRWGTGAVVQAAHVKGGSTRKVNDLLQAPGGQQEKGLLHPQGTG